MAIIPNGLNHKFLQLDKLRQASKNSPILITGANGFKGAWLTLLLQELGISSVGIGLATKPDSLWARLPEAKRIEFHEIDIREYKHLNDFIEKTKPEIVIHLAAQPLVTDGYLKPRETFETNIQGTVNLLDACLKNEVKVVQVITTDKVYQASAGLEKIYFENDSLGGADPYSSSKVAVEEVVKGFRSSPMSENSILFTVRAGNVVGGGDNATNRLLPDIMESLKTESQLVLRNPESVRPWQHVLDPLFGYLLAVEKVLTGGEIKTMNFGPDPTLALTVSEVMRIAASQWQGNQTETPYSFERAPYYETDFLQLSSDFAKSTLGWSTVWSQQEAIRATIDWEVKVHLKGLAIEEACSDDIKKLISFWSSIKSS